MASFNHDHDPPEDACELSVQLQSMAMEFIKQVRDTTHQYQMRNLPRQSKRPRRSGAA